MTYAIAKATQVVLFAEYRKASEAMRKYDAFKNSLGMTPDSVKWSQEWQADYRAYMDAFKAYRKYNETFVKQFHKEIRAEMRGAEMRNKR